MIQPGQSQKNITILHEAGIENPKAEQLAGLPWVNEKMIRTHVFQAIEIEHQTIALAIWRIEHNWWIK